METSTIICFANQWTSFYTIGTSAMKELRTYLTRRKTKRQRYSTKGAFEIEDSIQN